MALERPARIFFRQKCVLGRWRNEEQSAEAQVCWGEGINVGGLVWGQPDGRHTDGRTEAEETIGVVRRLGQYCSKGILYVEWLPGRRMVQPRDEMLVEVGGAGGWDVGIRKW